MESFESVQIYIYRWKPNALRTLDRYQQRCRVICRGGRNSCLVEFLADGFRAVISRNALRKESS